MPRNICRIVQCQQNRNSNIRLYYSISALDLSLIYSENQDRDIRGQESWPFIIIYLLIFAFKATSWYDLVGPVFLVVFSVAVYAGFIEFSIVSSVFCVQIVEHVCYLSHPQWIIAIVNILIISQHSLPFVGEKIHDKCHTSCKSEYLHYLRLYLNKNGKLPHLWKAKTLSILCCK